MNFKKNSFHFEGEPKIIKKNFVHNISNLKMLIKIVFFKRIKKINDNQFYWIDYNKIDNSFLDDDNETDRIVINSRVSFYAIIKSHGEFKGVKCTTLGKLSHY